MAKFETFDRDIRVATAGLSQEAISAQLARFAKAELAKAIASGEGSPIFARFVNGREGIAEESVSAPGPIIYQFSWWNIIIITALAELVKRSPRKSGSYASSFVVIVDGKPAVSFDDIAPGAEIIITNVQPYTRKIHVGAMRMSVPPKIFEGARQALFRKFGQQMLSCQINFLDLPGGIHPLVPYALKGRQITRSAAQNARSSAFRAGRATLARRKDSEAGQKLTYPSLVMNLVH